MRKWFAAVAVVVVVSTCVRGEVAKETMPPDGIYCLDSGVSIDLRLDGGTIYFYSYSETLAWCGGGEDHNIVTCNGVKLPYGVSAYWGGLKTVETLDDLTATQYLKIKNMKPTVPALKLAPLSYLETGDSLCFNGMATDTETETETETSTTLSAMYATPRYGRIEGEHQRILKNCLLDMRKAVDEAIQKMEDIW